MTLRERIERSIRRVTPQDLPALRCFQREMFGEDARQLNEVRHRWLFDENPGTDERGPQLWISEKEGQIVGQQGGIPFDLKIGDRYCRASWAIDLRVRPEYRLHGVGPILNAVYRRENDVTVGLGLTEEAYLMFRRAGWADLGFVPLYVLPLRLGAMLERRTDVHRLIRSGVRLAQPALSLGLRALGVYRRLRGTTLDRIEHFDERVERLWADVAGHYPVIARRDLRSRSWRFDRQPEIHAYEKYYLVARGTVRGYIVLRMGAAHGAPVGRIVDFLCAPQWILPLMALSVERFRQLGAASIHCCALTPEIQRLRWLGFRKRESTIHLMVQVDDRLGEHSTRLTDRRNWFVTMGDKDRDHGAD